MTPSEIARRLTPAQKRELDAVCRSNGAGLSTYEDRRRVKVWLKLHEMGLTQGKSGGQWRVVHTRLGWQVRSIIAQDPPQDDR